MSNVFAFWFAIFALSFRLLFFVCYYYFFLLSLYPYIEMDGGIKMYSARRWGGLFIIHFGFTVFRLVIDF